MSYESIFEARDSDKKSDPRASLQVSDFDRGLLFAVHPNGSSDHESVWLSQKKVDKLIRRMTEWSLAQDDIEEPFCDY